MKQHRDTTVLKIGELASRSGLTVRALHHYDSIGLLVPSARADSGYRLYNRADVARLHQIQALRRFGMSLADIATFLASPDAPFADVVAQQIEARASRSPKPLRCANNCRSSIRNWLAAANLNSRTGWQRWS